MATRYSVLSPHRRSVQISGTHLPCNMSTSLLRYLVGKRDSAEPMMYILEIRNTYYVCTSNDSAPFFIMTADNTEEFQEPTVRAHIP